MAGFDPNATVNRLKKQMETNFKKAGFFLVSQIRKALNVAQPYRRYTGAKGVYYKGFSPSSPGQFPKKLSGQLIKSITFNVETAPTLTLIVGSNLHGHPLYLELGTKRMKPRPWLSKSWTDNASKVHAMLTK